jgi:hypothetical protein
MNPQPVSSRPPLSVVFATRCRWSEIAAFLDVIEDQVRAVGGELLVVDGRSAALPNETEDAASWIHAPGSDVFELRALGAARARGEVVAYTEDHCEVAPDWCERILTAHRDHPDASVVAGAVLNGSEGRMIDRANFVLAHASNLPPLRDVPREWASSGANVSFKREVLPADTPGRGWLDFVVPAEAIAGGRFVVDDRIRVRHVQSYGVVGTVANWYHSGRCLAVLTAGLTPSVRRASLALTGLALPYSLLRRAFRVARSKPSGRQAYRLIAPMVVLAFGAATGFVMGVLAGPGNSLQRLR